MRSADAACASASPPRACPPMVIRQRDGAVLRCPGWMCVGSRCCALQCPTCDAPWITCRRQKEARSNSSSKKLLLSSRSWRNLLRGNGRGCKDPARESRECSVLTVLMLLSILFYQNMKIQKHGLLRGKRIGTLRRLLKNVAFSVTF